MEIKKYTIAFVISALIALVSCGNSTTAKQEELADIAFNSEPALSTLEQEIKSRNEIREIETLTRILFSYSGDAPICSFDTPSQMTPRFLVMYVSAVAGKYYTTEQMHLYENDNPHDMFIYFDYNQVRHILKEEFELEEIPFDVENKENFRVKWVAGTPQNTGVRDIKTTIVDDNTLAVYFTVANGDSALQGYFREYWNDEEKMKINPVVKSKMCFTFKRRDGENPMLVKSEYLG